MRTSALLQLQDGCDNEDGPSAWGRTESFGPCDSSWAKQLWVTAIKQAKQVGKLLFTLPIQLLVIGVVLKDSMRKRKRWVRGWCAKSLNIEFQISRPLLPPTFPCRERTVFFYFPLNITRMWHSFKPFSASKRIKWPDYNGYVFASLVL